MFSNLSINFRSYFSLVLPLVLCLACSEQDQTETPPPNEPDTTLNKKEVGAAAQHFLRSGTYDKITLEVLSVAGQELPQTVLNDFVSFVKVLVNKPNGVEIKSYTVPSPGQTTYTLDDLLNIEDKYRKWYNDKKVLSLYVFLADGAFKNEDVLGVAYRNTSFAIFTEQIKAHTGGIGQPDEDVVLQTVLRHEFGHLLGLVNVGTPMVNNHQDSQHGHHCNNSDCLMYYAVDTGDFLANLIGNNTPPPLDDNCKIDLKNNGGK